MYVGVGNLGGSLKHIRHVIHKALPRELSPSDLIKRWGQKQQRQGQAKVARVATESDARTATADAAYQKQMAMIQALTPEMMTPADPLPLMSAPKTPPAVAKAKTNYVPWVAGGAAVLALALFMRRKGKRR